MAADDGGAELTVPPTIQALLAAPIDQLDSVERAVLALALAPEEPAPEACVPALVRKELVRPEQPTLPAEDAYRFATC